MRSGSFESFRSVKNLERLSKKQNNNQATDQSGTVDFSCQSPGVNVSPQMFSGFSRYFHSVAVGLDRCTQRQLLPFPCVKDMNPGLMPTRNTTAVRIKAPWRLTTTVSPSHVRGSLTPRASTRTFSEVMQILRAHPGQFLLPALCARRSKGPHLPTIRPESDPFD